MAKCLQYKLNQNKTILTSTNLITPASNTALKRKHLFLIFYKNTTLSDSEEIRMTMEREVQCNHERQEEQRSNSRKEVRIAF